MIASAEKVVERLKPPVPLELLRFGVHSTLHRIGPVRLRALSPAASRPERAVDDELRDALVSPDGGLIADFHGEIGDPAALAARLSATPGVIGHGLFAPEMVTLMLIAGEHGVETPCRIGAPRLTLGRSSSNRIGASAPPPPPPPPPPPRRPTSVVVRERSQLLR